jgi:dephospho-CoA kinase
VLRVGLTGGIACGKSLVGEMFAARGTHVIQADRIAHELMQPGLPVYHEIVGHFGPDILDNDGNIIRRKLADAAFGASVSVRNAGESRVQELNRIVHPAVLRRQDEWMGEVGSRNPHAIAMVEAALIVEAGAARRFDKLIVVTCHPEQRVARLAQKLNVDTATARGEVERRSAAQAPDAEKLKHADYVIDNSGTAAETEKQVAKIWSELGKLA